MSDSEDDERVSKSKTTPKKGKKAPKNIEEEFQKVQPLEHVLLRPDTYIGSVESVTQEMWVFDTLQQKMVQREIKFCPGLYKIFDEIIVNAADNKQRDNKMSCIKITIDPDLNEISVWNDGEGIPVAYHKTEKMYVPSLIFGHLLTSSNFNDNDQKTTGGRNGYGAKLCNIFSTKFIVETSSSKYKKKFRQEWCSNMGRTSEPKIEDSSRNDPDYTKITFYPDLPKFKMEKLDRDIVDLMSRRAYDVAGVSNVKVILNGQRLPVKNFKDYVDLYIKDSTDEMGNPLKLVHEKFEHYNPELEKKEVRWEIAATTSDTGFNQISFVNSIATTKGGRHVEYITDQLVKAISAAVKKKNKNGIDIKPFQIRNHLWVFITCLIENPTFDSQTKENMTLQVSSFGSKCPLTEKDKFMNQLLKCGVVENILAFAKAKAETQMGKKIHGAKTSKLKGIPKLEDANDAGTKKSADCTLILTEGDSAKSLVMAGFSVVGRDKYGVFPLRGKLLNVREATPKQVMENAEINNVVKIMGLQYKRKYETEQDIKSLRYGRLMIMTDQDQDGSHIKGLLINFIHHNWPSLLKMNFLVQFITPIVKVKKGDFQRSFYSLPEYEEWKKETTDWNRYNVKYYKGLGTSKGPEGKEYFSDLARHQVDFKYGGPQDDDYIDLAFNKKKADDRKDWLIRGLEERKLQRERGEGEVYLYGLSKEDMARSKNRDGPPMKKQQISYKDFINKELILFSNMDNERSIPSMVDGLKPGQRKVLFTCFKRNDKREVKVAQLAGSVAELSAYHHGEQSLMSTIIGLAQDYVGSNNINLLLPEGQFGTRLQGGKDAASPRYIFTMLSQMARAIFHPDDAPLLNYLHDDNQKIEPEWYIPIVPMVLINGAEGIGTGWMTKIPNYNPRDIVDNIRKLLAGERPNVIVPFYKGYRGEIKIIDRERCVTNGEIAILEEEDSIEITELPIRKWTQDYKEGVLEPMLNGSDDKKGKVKQPQILDYKEYHTDVTVRFVVKMSPEKFKEFEKEGFHKAFKLQTTISTTSMVLFDSKGCIRKYDTPEQILQEFFDLRLARYTMRKDYLNQLLTAEALKLQNQARFIEMKIKGEIKQENVKEKDVIAFLLKEKFDSDPVKEWKKKSPLQEPEEPPTEGDDTAVALQKGGPDYDYLLDMRFRNVHSEHVAELRKRRDTKIAERDELRKKTPQDLWNADLDEFLRVLDKVEQKEREIDGQLVAAKAKDGGRGKADKKGRNSIHNKANTKPSATGVRVEPIVDAGLLLRFEKAKEAKERKATGEAAPRGGKKKADKVTKEGGDNDEDLTDDKCKKGDASKKLKQTTLDGKFSKKNKKKARDSDDESEYDSEKESDDEVVCDDDEDEDEDDYEKEEKMPKKDRRIRSGSIDKKDRSDSVDKNNRRDHSESIEIEEILTKPVVKPKAEPAKKTEKKAAAAVKPEQSKPQVTSTATNGAKSPTKVIQLVSSDEDEDDKLAKKSKPAPKKSQPDKKIKAPVKRAREISPASSEDFIPTSSRAVLSPKKAKQDNKKAIVDDSDEDEEVAPRSRPGRRAAPKKYVLDDSMIENQDDDDEDYLETVDD